MEAYLRGDYVGATARFAPDGQCVRKADFRSRSEALEAAGLRE